MQFSEKAATADAGVAFVGIAQPSSVPSARNHTLGPTATAAATKLSGPVSPYAVPQLTAEPSDRIAMEMETPEVMNTTFVKPAGGEDC